MTTGQHTQGTGMLRIFLLDEFRVEAGGCHIDHSAWRLRKAQSLVKILALTPERRLHREQLMEMLWPDAGRVVVPDAIEMCLGSTSHYVGLLAETLGQDAEARQAYEAAIDMNQSMGVRPCLAHAHRMARLARQCISLRAEIQKYQIA